MQENNWWDYPQKIKNWTKDIENVMFVDENGNGGRIIDICRKIENNIIINDDEKYFTITGCIFGRKDYSIMRNEIKKLKEKYWQDGYYYDSRYNENRYVCLHSREIRRHDGPFNDSIINHRDFVDDLSFILDKVNCIIVLVTINLEEYIKQKVTANVYNKAFDILFEKYLEVTKNNKKGIIMLESRGKEDDKNLLKHISDIIVSDSNNTRVLKKEYSGIYGVYFNPKWYNGHSSTFLGLEITDLFSYPIHQYMKYNKENTAFKVIKSKLYLYPLFENEGIIIYPKEKDG